MSTLRASGRFGCGAGVVNPRPARWSFEASLQQTLGLPHGRLTSLFAPEHPRFERCNVGYAVVAGVGEEEAVDNVFHNACNTNGAAMTMSGLQAWQHVSAINRSRVFLLCEALRVHITEARGSGREPPRRRPGRHVQEGSPAGPCRAQSEAGRSQPQVWSSQALICQVGQSAVEWSEVLSPQYWPNLLRDVGQSRPNAGNIVPSLVELGRIRPQGPNEVKTGSNMAEPAPNSGQTPNQRGTMMGGLACTTRPLGRLSRATLPSAHRGVANRPPRSARTHIRGRGPCGRRPLGQHAQAL